MLDKLKNLFNKNKKTNQSDDGDTQISQITEMDSESAEKPKKSISPVTAVLVLAIIYLGMDYFIPQDEAEQTATPNPATSQANNQAGDKASNQAAGNTQPVETAEVKPDPSSDNMPTENSPQDVNVADQPGMPSEAEMAATIDSTNQNMDKQPASDFSNDAQQMHSNVEKGVANSNDPAGSDMGLSESGSNTNMPIDNMNSGTAQNAEQVGQGDSMGTSEANQTVETKKPETSPVEVKDHSFEGLKRDIAQTQEASNNKSMEYVAPPSFLDEGRGLVYNCEGKHWACVDKPNYFQCARHYMWSSMNNTDPKCVIKNVYVDIKDCHSVQLSYTSNSEPTDFCQLKDQ